MPVIIRRPLVIGFALAWMSLLTPSPAESQSEFEFFESRIRPVLIEHCYACHNSSETAEGGLSLDFDNLILRVSGIHRDGIVLAVLSKGRGRGWTALKWRWWGRAPSLEPIVEGNATISFFEEPAHVI